MSRRHCARKFEELGAQPEAMRFQVEFPSEINFGGFAAQCRRPMGFARLSPRPASFLPMQETPLEPAGCIGESSAYLAAGIG